MLHARLPLLLLLEGTHHTSNLRMKESNFINGILLRSSANKENTELEEIQKTLLSIKCNVKRADDVTKASIISTADCISPAHSMIDKNSATHLLLLLLPHSLR